MRRHSHAALDQIKLMGEFAIRIGDGEPVTLPPKVQALAAYLVLRGGGSVNREQVREMLWPDRGEEQARHSMRQALFVLRRDGFGSQDFVRSRDNALALLPQSAACDVLSCAR